MAYAAQYALGLGVIAILLYGCLHLWRQRVKRRDEAQFDIPDFLEGASQASDDAGGRLQTDWTEVHRLRRVGKFRE